MAKASLQQPDVYKRQIKDRLYCEGKDSLERRSAQTALFLILDTMTKLFAPILAFTCDEIWLAMPQMCIRDRCGRYGGRIGGSAPPPGPDGHRPVSYTHLLGDPCF